MEELATTQKLSSEDQKKEVDGLILMLKDLSKITPTFDRTLAKLQNLRALMVSLELDLELLGPRLEAVFKKTLESESARVKFIDFAKKHIPGAFEGGP